MPKQSRPGWLPPGWVALSRSGTTLPIYIRAGDIVAVSGTEFADLTLTSGGLALVAETPEQVFQAITEATR